MRYNFYITDGQGLYIDSIGLEMPSSCAAMDRAWHTAYQLMHELAAEVHDWTKWRFQVIDEEQGDCLILPFYYIQRRESTLRERPPFSSIARSGPEQSFWC